MITIESEIDEFGPVSTLFLSDIPLIDVEKTDSDNLSTHTTSWSFDVNKEEVYDQMIRLAGELDSFSIDNWIMLDVESYGFSRFHYINYRKFMVKNNATVDENAFDDLLYAGIYSRIRGRKTLIEEIFFEQKRINLFSRCNLAELVSELFPKTNSIGKWITKDDLMDNLNSLYKGFREFVF